MREDIVDTYIIYYSTNGSGKKKVKATLLQPIEISFSFCLLILIGVHMEWLYIVGSM